MYVQVDLTGTEAENDALVAKIKALGNVNDVAVHVPPPSAHACTYADISFTGAVRSLYEALGGNKAYDSYSDFLDCVRGH